MGFHATKKFSSLALLRHGLDGHRTWPEILPDQEPRPAYDIVIVGGGGHGLATAYYLARRHSSLRIAVFEANWIGSGNTTRNTAIIRSDYLLEASFALKNLALQMWHKLGQELNFNLMVSPRGYIDLAHSDDELEQFTVRANAMRLGGSDAEILNRETLAQRVPQLDLSERHRFPIVGALFQRSGGIVRHDAVAWGYARKAAAMGVHIFQNTPVTGFETEHGRLTGLNTGRGRIACGKALISVAGNSAEVAGMAGFPLPVMPINVQAFVTEPVKPALDCVVNYNAGLTYVSQSAKGEFVVGGATDGYCSTARRGSFARIEEALARAVQMFPFLSRLRLMRHWSGTADMTPDGNAIVGRTPVDGLVINSGWGYAGFKATPAVGFLLADLLVDEKLPELLVPFALDRFETGALIDDAGIGPWPWMH